MANDRGHGGKRAGSGPRTNPEKHQEAVAGFTDLAAGYLHPQAFDRLKILAEGGFERVECKYKPASSITIKAVAREPDGSIVRDSKGKPSLVDALLYPDLAADAEVLVERKVSYAEPNFKALELIVDRVMGTPRPSPEEAADLLEIRQAVLDATARIAERKARLAAEAEAEAETPPTTLDHAEPDQ